MFKISAIIALVIPLIVCTACPGFEGGFRRPACKYDKKAVEAYVSKFTAENDSLISISFKSVSKEGKSAVGARDSERPLVTLRSYEISNLGLNYVNVSDSTKRYLVKGSFITQGTCSPSMISSVEVIE